MSVKPSGTKAPSRAERSVTTPGASIQFSTPFNQFGFGEVPGLVINARNIKDASPKEFSLSPEEFNSITDLNTLKDTVTSAYETNREYLEATETKGKNEALATAGSRKLAFFNAVSNNLYRTALPTGKHLEARRLLKGLEEATYMGHAIEFDTVKLDTYHPYSSPFDTGVRKLRGLAPEGIERDNITDELNYITDRKTQHGWGPVNEKDAESSLRLRAIDRGNDNQSISVARDSSNPQRPSYVIINVNSDGLPEGTKEHAGKAVTRDGDLLYFDKTGILMPKELNDHLTEKSSSDKLGLRLFKRGEKPRNNFPYDWNKNHSINFDPINIGWWGHCHIEAPLASLSVNAGSEVTVFDTRSKGVKSFDDTDVNDLLFAMLDTTNYLDISNSRGASAGKTVFVGNRNDTTGGERPEHKLILKVNGVERSFPVRIKELSTTNGSEQSADLDAIFLPATLLSEGIQFKANPAFEGWRNIDWSTINGERKIVGSVEYMDVNTSGSIERKVTDIVLDPANPSEKPVLIGSTLGSDAYPPKVTRHYLNEVTGQLESKTFAPEKEADGKYKMVPTSEEATLQGEVTDRILTKELVKESIIALHEHVLNSARRGVSFVTEKSSGNMVWNYGTNGMTLTEVEKDGDFTKYTISLKTQGGEKEWSYILEYNQHGTPINAHALDQPADFVWRPERWVSAPLFRGEHGQLLYNSSAYERGFLLDGDGKLSPEGLSFFRYASDVIYASLADPEKDTRYVVIDDDGELYFYNDLEAYKTEVTTLGGDAAAINAPPPPEPELNLPENTPNPFLDSNGYVREQFHSAAPARPTEEVGPATDNGETVPATFRARIARIGEGDTPVLVGNVPSLGEWDPQNGIEFETGMGVFPYWHAEVELPTDQTIEFKWVIRRSDGTIEWEHGPNRTLETLSFGPPSIANGFYDEERIHWRMPSA